MLRTGEHYYDRYEMGRRTVRMVYAALIDHPRWLEETQEDYAERIVLLVVRQMMEELGLHSKTQD